MGRPHVQHYVRVSVSRLQAGRPPGGLRGSVALKVFSSIPTGSAADVPYRYIDIRRSLKPSQLVSKSAQEKIAKKIRAGIVSELA
jgi:hypothetical protein